MDIKIAYDVMMNNKYYTSRELKYKLVPGFHMSGFEYKNLLELFDKKAEENNDVIGLDLYVFNPFKIRISQSLDLLSKLTDYFNLIISDVIKNKSFLTFRNLDSIIKSRIFSEIEGTLNIESVPTTRKLLNDIIYKNKKPENNDEQIILNMAKAIEFVNTCPAFNEESLYQLYCLLSKDCLNKDQQLLPGNLYRHDEVEVDNYFGCPHQFIKNSMDSLFEFVNENLNNNKIKFYLPHIAHYYIAYIHPYFDLNGRTARMVSYWISLLQDNKVMPPLLSEAINQTKSEYYAALRETRNSHNDLTYFLLYIYDVSIRYFLTYKNIEAIDENLKAKGIVLSDGEKTYLKKIFISSRGTFIYEDFIKWSNTEMSKQAALKFLNQFVKYGVLKAEINSSNKKLFEVNKKVLQYNLFNK